MRHYEIVVLVHPDQSEQSVEMIERYKKIIEESGGIVHRHEDWGRRLLAYPIEKIHKAHYHLINVECTLDPLNEIVEAFKFNDAILRHLVIKRKNAMVEPSIMLKTIEDIAAKEKKYEFKAKEDVDSLESSESSDKKKTDELVENPEKIEAMED